LNIDSIVSDIKITLSDDKNPSINLPDNKVNYLDFENACKILGVAADNIKER